MSKAERMQAREREEQDAGTARYSRLAASGKALVALVLGHGTPADFIGSMCVSKIGGVSGGQVYNWAEGHSPVHLAALGPLGVVQPAAVVQLCSEVLAPLGYQPAVAPVTLASAPTLHEALQSVADSAACCSETTALEFATLHDGELSAAELRELEAQWAREDEQREGMREKLRAMALHAQRQQGEQVARAKAEVTRLKAKGGRS